MFKSEQYSLECSMVLTIAQHIVRRCPTNACSSTCTVVIADDKTNHGTFDAIITYVLSNACSSTWMAIIAYSKPKIYRMFDMIITYGTL